MSDEAIALIEIKSGWLVRVTEHPENQPRVTRVPIPAPTPLVVIGVVSQVEDRMFRVGSLAELGDGKSYLFKRRARPNMRVEVLDKSGELEIDVVDDRPLKVVNGGKACNA